MQMLNSKIVTLIAGCIIGIFIVMVFQYINEKYFLKNSDNVSADEVFADYINSKGVQSKNIRQEETLINSYISNLVKAQQIIDSLKSPMYVFDKKDTLALVRLHAQAAPVIQQMQNARTFTLSQFSKSEKISEASRKIEETYFYAFQIYWNISQGKDYSSAEDLFAILKDEGRFKTGKQNLISVINQQISELNIYSSSLRGESDSLMAKVNSARGAQTKTTENSRDKLLITMVIPIFAGILAIIIFTPYFLRNNSEMFKKILDDKILLQVFTIFILVISVLLLGIGGKLSNETLGTLLGGISVYVLQKSLEPRSNGGNPNTNNSSNT